MYHYLLQIDKPLAERKRRARINDALLQLKNMVLQSVDKQVSTNVFQ